MNLHDRIVGMLPDKVNADEHLVWRGRHINLAFILRAGEQDFLITIQEGRITSVKVGPLVMPTWTFRLDADEAAWQEFWQPVPRPGFHDLMAMLKFRKLRIEGTLHPFMANILYFKQLIASIRIAKEEVAQ